MKISKVVTVFVCTLWLQTCMCKLYSSTYEMLQLLKTERKIIEGLLAYFERQEKNGITFESEIKEFVDEVEKQNNVTIDNLSTTANPLTTFHLLYRAVQTWSKFSENLTCQDDHDHDEECPVLTGADVIDVIKRREGASHWPNEVELKHAAKAIINVWNVYDLKLEDLVKGSLGDVAEEGLSADEIFFIANIARDAGMTYEAITWFDFLLKRLESFGPHKFQTSSLYRRLALTYHEYGMTSKGIELLKECLKKEPDHNGVSRDLDYLQKTGAVDDVKELVRFRPKDISKATKDRQNFEELCRSAAKGEFTRSNYLKCSLVPLFNYYGKAKVELLSKYPRIEILYDVADENETKEIISYGDRSFAEFYEIFPFDPAPAIVDNRLKSGPMCEWSAPYPLMINVTDRLERMTRFHMYPVEDISSSECYIMTNEGPGYISQPLVDFYAQAYLPYPYAGNRQATIMLQLSDVQYGGSMVFPKLNITVPVTKGAAVVWWNLRRDGSPSLRSTHMTCPVLVGSNWALYKNVLYSNQLFRRPCETN